MAANPARGQLNRENESPKKQKKTQTVIFSQLPLSAGTHAYRKLSKEGPRIQ